MHACMNNNENGIERETRLVVDENPPICKNSTWGLGIYKTLQFLAHITKQLGGVCKKELDIKSYSFVLSASNKTFVLLYCCFQTTTTFLH